MEFHKFPSTIILYILIFALLYYMNSDIYSGIDNFGDAILYSLANTCMMNYSTVEPMTDTAKVISSVQTLLSFTSLFSTSVFQTKDFMRFIMINISILLAIVLATTYYKERIVNFNYLTDIPIVYETVRTHCLIDLKPDPDAKLINIIHVMLVSLVIFKFNNGIFQRISDPVFGPSLYKVK